MSDQITLTLRPLLVPVTAPDLRPDVLSELSAQQIADLPVWMGRDLAKLGDAFLIKGERSPHVLITGVTERLVGVGAGMRSGELTVDGDVGDDAGAGMSGGTLHVRGNVGHAAGTAMAGGILRIDGSAGDRLGSALPGASKGMTGGEIVVHGSAGAEAGARARRGLIVVAGDVGRDAARAMIAGTLVVLGSCGENAGRGSKRGSLVACGDVTVPATYRYACTFSPPHVRMTMTYLKRRYGLPVTEAFIEGRYQRFCGDAGDPGKGEILLLDRSV